MAVSVSNTAYGIINDAMHDAGYLREGSIPNSDQLASNMRRLCDIINVLQIGGCKLFLLQEISVTLVAGTNSYTVNPTSLYPTKHMRIEQARIQLSDGTYRPINQVSWNEWNSLPQNNEGAITGFLEDRQATSLNVKVWNTPDTSEAANTLVLLVRTQAANPYNLESDVSFPQEWRMALRWGLADDISTGQPQAIMDRCTAKFRFYKDALEDFDVEGAQVTFSPDMRYASG